MLITVLALIGVTGIIVSLSAASDARRTTHVNCAMITQIGAFLIDLLGWGRNSVAILKMTNKVWRLAELLECESP